MNPGQYQQSPQNEGLPSDFLYDDDPKSSQQSFSFFPFDGLPRPQLDHSYLNPPLTSSPIPSAYDFVSQMPTPPPPASWVPQAHTSPAFEDRNTSDYYNYSPAPGDHDQAYLESYSTPRTWPPYAMGTTFDPSDYLLNSSRNSGHHSPSMGALSQASNTFDNNQMARMSISSSPKVESSNLADSGSFNTSFKPRATSSEGSETGARNSREATIVDGEDHGAEEPYAKLIYRALMSVPGHSMVLQDIYKWFRENTTKGGDDTKGWMNSIRHNLSMNAAFKKTERKVPGDETKKSTEWVLEDFAIKDGVQSTTRYRKGTGAKRINPGHYGLARQAGPNRKGGVYPPRSKLQRSRVTNDDRRTPQRIDTGGGHFQNCTQPHVMQRRLSPLTPDAESMDSVSPYFVPKKERCAYENMYAFGDVQGVYLEDPLFSNHENSQFANSQSMCMTQQL